MNAISQSVTRATAGDPTALWLKPGRQSALPTTRTSVVPRTSCKLICQCNAMVAHLILAFGTGSSDKAVRQKLAGSLTVQLLNGLLHKLPCPVQCVENALSTHIHTALQKSQGSVEVLSTCVGMPSAYYLVARAKQRSKLGLNLISTSH